MIFIKIFLTFAQIGLFSFGGGFATLSLIQGTIVETNHWLTMHEFTDLIAIAEMTPGPIAINTATFVGNRLGGMLGAVVATAGCVTPPCIIVLVLAYLYNKYKDLKVINNILIALRPAIVVMILNAGYKILKTALFKDVANGFVLNNINYVAILIMSLAFLLMRKLKFQPIYAMLSCGFIGMLIYLFI